MDPKKKEAPQAENVREPVVLGSSALQPAPIANTEIDAKTLEIVLLQGDLSVLNATQRLAYYRRMCESSGLNPLAKPFEYINMKGEKGAVKLVLYARAEAFDQIRSNTRISVTVLDRIVDVPNGIYTIRVQGKTIDGRVDEASGSVPITKEGGNWAKTAEGKSFWKGDGTIVPMRGEDLANAYMKAETKAKRRLTLSMTGLALAGVVTSDTGDMPVEAEKAIDDATMTLIKQGQEFLKLAPADLGGMAKKYDTSCTSLSTMVYDAGIALLNDICDAVLAVGEGKVPDGVSPEFATELTKHTKEAMDAEAKAISDRF